MKNALIAGNLRAGQGEKVHGFLNVCGSGIGCSGSSGGGEHGKMPATLINGEYDGKTVVITGGTHGGEYPGVETAIRLARDLDPKEISGNIIIVHPVNILAFKAKLQYLNPEDGKNLNREYPGKAAGTFTERVAYTISSELLRQADFYMDLHGGDIHEALTPFIIVTEAASDDVNRVSREAASLFGIKYVIGSATVSGTFGAAGQMGVPGFLSEIGQCGLWSEAEVERYIWGCKNVLKYLKVLPGEAVQPGVAGQPGEAAWTGEAAQTGEAVQPGEAAWTGEVIYASGMTSAAATATGCFYPFVKPGDKVRKGQKLCEIRDYFGKLLAEYESEKDGVILYVISSLPINEGEPIYALL